MCYIDTYCFIIQIKIKKFHQDVEKKFDTSSYKETERPLPVGKNKTIMSLMKDKQGGDIMKEIAELRSKMYSFIKIMLYNMIKLRIQKMYYKSRY